jgi:pimeloyl-ACP methyl ester carboxylesterase
VTEPLHHETRGAGTPTLVLLHGMGATGAVWEPLVDVLKPRWPGRIVVPDLHGHGRSPRLPLYSYGAMAAGVADLVRREDGVVAVGHSMGGVVALALGSGWFGCPVAKVVATSVKVRWNDDELLRMAALAAKPPVTFNSAAAALDRYLRVSGLESLVTPSSSIAAAGVVAVDGGFALAHDPGSMSMGAPDMAGLLAACRARVVLACGTEDQMVTPADLRELHPAAVVLDGVGHNPHVETPERFADVVLADG